MATLFAEDLTGPEFSDFVSADTVALLPVAAIEPHGPHLPLSTDCDIARGHLSRLPGYLPDEIDVLVLPMQTVGHSVEHSGFPGAFSHSAETLLKVWEDVCAVFASAGGRRLIVVSSHGGNSEVVNLLNQRLTASRAMLAISASWTRFGQPVGMFDAHELAYGIHGGDLETSLMLHYFPQAVRQAHRQDFVSAAEDWEAETKHLTVSGRSRMAWMSSDLNPAGVVGNALAASAEKGAASADHTLMNFAELIVDVAQFDLSRLGARPQHE